mmetsp:Transcript_17325/g.50942  ORF Transcript_17325/g.50942 Transcript_17325/m.50942 type:complete len:139 (-) Transcript_17325:1338-1754(-)
MEEIDDEDAPSALQEMEATIEAIQDLRMQFARQSRLLGERSHAATAEAESLQSQMTSAVHAILGELSAGDPGDCGGGLQREASNEPHVTRAGAATTTRPKRRPRPAADGSTNLDTVSLAVSSVRGLASRPLLPPCAGR